MFTARGMRSALAGAMLGVMLAGVAAVAARAQDERRHEEQVRPPDRDRDRHDHDEHRRVDRDYYYAPPPPAAVYAPPPVVYAPPPPPAGITLMIPFFFR
ncbi:MAG TPA: hypothetical protein VN668_00450 [Stellaceae bacterium]|nr:hypothetical protein [Stellaceae bacterium]